jgi:o-succinylbenzoate---CoA ligase
VEPVSDAVGGRARAVLLADAGRRDADERGDLPAVIDGPRRWTWRELDARAAAVAAGLVTAGAAGARIALLAPSGAATVAFLHGAARAGTVVVPLSDRLADAELRAYLADLEVTVMAVADGLATRASSLAPRVLGLEALLESPAGDPAAAPVADQADPSAPAIIVATSGTTGRPKGAVLTHGQIAASAAAWNDFLPPATGWLASLSSAHVGGLGIIWRAALAGVPVVVTTRGDPGSWLAAIAEPPVSHVSVVAVQLARLLDAAAGPPPPGLRAVLLGGGPVPAALVLRALDRGWPVVPTYGMTESASGVTALPTAEASARPESAGRALPGVELRIADPAGDGVGEIEVRGPSIFVGYAGRPDETAEAFTPDGWYRTGDLGRLDAAGYMTVADRRLDLIVSGGENVYPAEVEAVLVGHPSVADAGVAGRPDPTWGSVPIAAVVVRPGAIATDDDILAYCRGRLAGFKVPVAIARVAAVPRYGTGKLNREALRELLPR